MKLLRYAGPDGPAFGMLEEQTVYTLEGDPFDPATWARGRAVGPLKTVTLLAPCTPSKIIAMGRNYAAHAAEFGHAPPDEPLLFFKPPSAVIGPGAPIVLPPQSARVEHEAELCLVIGRRCRNVPLAEAWGYVLGVTCGNDVTARDVQRREKQWARSKGFDTSAPLGPWIVTGLPVAQVSNLSITCQVNNRTRQRGHSGDMIFGPAALVSAIAETITLQPGDVVMTGTPAGVGPLVAGDEVTVTIEQVGTLSNPVSAAE